MSPSPPAATPPPAVKEFPLSDTTQAEAPLALLDEACADLRAAEGGDAEGGDAEVEEGATEGRGAGAEEHRGHGALPHEGCPPDRPAVGRIFLPEDSESEGDDDACSAGLRLLEPI